SKMLECKSHDRRRTKVLAQIDLDPEPRKDAGGIFGKLPGHQAPVVANHHALILSSVHVLKQILAEPGARLSNHKTIHPHGPSTQDTSESRRTKRESPSESRGDLIKIFSLFKLQDFVA